MKVNIPRDLPDTLPLDFRAASLQLAREFAEPGTCKYLLLKMGFMPHNEEDALKLVERLIRERDYLEAFIELLPEPDDRCAYRR